MHCKIITSDNKSIHLDCCANDDRFLEDFGYILFAFDIRGLENLQKTAEIRKCRYRCTFTNQLTKTPAD
jgi:hypothetical protein